MRVSKNATQIDLQLDSACFFWLCCQIVSEQIDLEASLSIMVAHCKKSPTKPVLNSVGATDAARMQKQCESKSIKSAILPWCLRFVFTGVINNHWKK